MNKYLKSTLILLILDFLWIALFMGKKYQQTIPKIQKENLKINQSSALIVYILMIIGLNIFVVPNIRKENRLKDSLIYGFIFGIILYGVYDFTSGVVFKNWNFKLAIIDVIWGGFVYFISAYLGSV